MTATTSRFGTGSRPPSRLLARAVAIAPFAPIFIFLAVLLVYPVSHLLMQSFLDATGAFSLEHYQRVFGSSIYVRVLGTTFWFAAWTTILCLILGYPLAYLLASLPEAQRNRLVLWVLLPFWTSFLVRTFAWIVLLGRNGAINHLLGAAGMTEAPLPLIYNSMGVLIGLVHAMLPIAVLTMTSVMQTIDARLVNAARTLGARGGQAFWQVYFPLSMPGVAAAGILVFVSTLGFFITPALLGSGREITISQVIIDEIQTLNWAFGGALGVLLISAAVLAFLVYDRIFGLSSLAATTVFSRAGSRKGWTAHSFERVLRDFINAMTWLSGRVANLVDAVLPRRHSSRPVPLARALHWTFALLTIVFLAVPSFFVVPISFTQGSFLEWPPQGFSLKWYREFFSSELWLSAILRSLLVGVASASLAVAIGVPAAFAIVRGTASYRAVIVAFVLSPLIVPRIIIAIALFYLYAKIGLVGTSLGLVLGHTVLALPYVVITIMAMLKTYDQRLDQAARSLGASHPQMLRFVTLPLILPGLIAAFLFAFVTSFDELTLALFVTGGLTTTLPKQMWDGALLNVGPIVTAASTVTLVLVTGIILLAQRFQKRALGRTH